MKKTKKDNTEKTVEEFEREAKARIAARKGKGPKLAQTYDELILASIAVIDAYEKSRPFYEDGTHVGMDHLISSVLNDPKDALCLWLDIAHTPYCELEKCPPSKEQQYVIEEATCTLMAVLCALNGSSSKPFLKFFPKDWWEKEKQPELEALVLELLFLAFSTSALEIDIALEHYTKWEREWENDDFPVHFLTEASVEAKKKLWAPISKAARDVNTLFYLLDCEKLRRLKPVACPTAFVCQGERSAEVYRLGDSVKKALSFPQACGFHINLSISWLPVRAAWTTLFDFERTILGYVRRARIECANYPSAKRKWIEVEAELVKHWDICGAPITPEVADRIIALADDAAREHWIEARMGKDTTKQDETTDQLLKNQLEFHAEIRKFNTEGRKLLKSIQANTCGEYTKKNERSSANKNRVEDALERRDKLINEGMSKHNALTPACKDTVKKMGLGNYKNIASLRAAVNREIKYRNDHYGANAAPVNWPNPK